MVPKKLSRRHKHRSRRPGLLLLALCVLAPVLAACGQDGADHTGVLLLPDAAANGKAWDWTARCQFGPSARNACEPSGPDLGVAQLNGDEWNLGGGTTTAGSLGMSVTSPGALLVRGDFPSAPPCVQSSCLAPSAYTWVRGYPNVLYGINLCHEATSPPESKILRLPMQVKAIPPDFIGTTTYAAHSGQVTYDVAYDLWLNPSATKRPCRTDGTLELMIWTDYDEKALLPASMEVGTASIPFSIAGAVRPDTQAWSIYASNIFAKGQTAPWGGAVWVVLNAADIVAKGTVSGNLGSVLSAVGSLLQNNYGWSDFAKRYWLDSIPFGTEFGPQDGALTGTGSSYFSLKLSSYCLTVRTTLSRAGCGSLQQG